MTTYKMSASNLNTFDFKWGHYKRFVNKTYTVQYIPICIIPFECIGVNQTYTRQICQERQSEKKT